MLFSKPLKFLACAECGGAGNSSQSSTDVTKSSKYPALSAANLLKLIGVAASGEQQQYLTGTTLPGFVWIDEDGIASVNVAPELTLPDALSGGINRLLGGTPNTNSKWQMLVAPATGNYVLVVKDGAYSLVGMGAVPLDTLGTLGGTASPLILAGIRDLGGGIWSTDKLAVAAQRVLVGDGDGVSVKSLPTNEWLVHPLGQFSMLRLETYTQLDNAGLPVAGGIAAGVNDGTNNVLAIYNISSNKFFRAPVRVKNETTATTGGGSVHVADDGAWHPLDPHCKFTDTFNYPEAFVNAYIRAQITNIGVGADDYTMDFGLFVDGAKIDGSAGPEKIWDIQGSKDNNVAYLMKGLTLGSHTIEIKCRKNAVVDQTMRIVVSNMQTFSVM